MSTMYEAGDTVRAFASFRVNTITVTDGVPAVTATPLTEPTTVTLAVTDPSGARTTYTYADGDVTRHSTGVYYRDILLTLPGEWVVHWTGTGAVVATKKAVIKVRTTVAL